MLFFFILLQAERSFSVMNKIKRNERTSLSQESLEAILSIQLNGPSPTVWYPNEYSDDYLAAGHKRCDPADRDAPKSPKKEEAAVPDAFKEFDDQITYYSAIF